MAAKFNPPHIYDNVSLDRASLLRMDQRWLREKRRDPRSLVIAFSGLDVHIEDADDRPRLARITVETLGRPVDDAGLFLGLLGGTPVFAEDIGKRQDHPGTAVELRSVGRYLDRGDAGMLAYARGVMHWHRGHRYCGACGQMTEIVQGGHARRCGSCAKEVFPRTDPAVIVLVIHDDHCLLGRSARFPGNMYSTLAGFVEPGESLEHCLRREVFEEAGVEIADWQYRSSQPWPFPQSLMLGFWATAKDRRLEIDHDELEDALWIERKRLRDPATRPVQLPNEDSIARALIEDWLDEA